MSYALGQAKVLPGQINFLTTRTGRIPNLQPLIEAGLPYAPYIEHGSWVTGQPDIARYGRDPYRGLFGLGQDLTGQAAENLDAAATHITQAGAHAAREVAQGGLLVGLGVVVGGAVGAGSGALKKPVLGAMLGAIGGGVLGYLAKDRVLRSTAPASPGLSGVLAVL